MTTACSPTSDRPPSADRRRWMWCSMTMRQSRPPSPYSVRCGSRPSWRTALRIFAVRTPAASGRSICTTIPPWRVGRSPAGQWKFASRRHPRFAPPDSFKPPYLPPTSNRVPQASPIAARRTNGRSACRTLRLRAMWRHSTPAIPAPVAGKPILPAAIT